jgi:hypothetical protein
MTRGQACIFGGNRRISGTGELRQQDENTIGDRVFCDRDCGSADTRQLVQNRRRLMAISARFLSTARPMLLSGLII